VAIDGDPRCAGVERRGIDLADGAPLRHVLRRHVRPVLPAVARELDQSIIRSGPQQVFLHGRFGEREDGVVVLDAGDVEGDRAAGRLLLILVAVRSGLIRFSCGRRRSI
jgi:hypothetical protein